MPQLFNKMLRAGEGKNRRKLERAVVEVAAWEETISALSDDELRAKTEEFRQRYKDGEDLDDFLPEAFACVREAGKRAMNMRHFDVQVMGAAVLHGGDIAEMKTGEGKTLVATMPLYLNSLTGRGTHLVTVNDYLARRDAEWMKPIYDALGVTVGIIQSDMDPEARRQAYACDVTYGTNSEFGFDYLRDNLAVSLDQTVQPDHYFAIVDEVDSILIDEARTPLIISGQPEEAPETYYTFAKIARTLSVPDDYEVDEKRKTVAPTEEGVHKVEQRPRRRQPVRAAEQPAGQPPDPVAEGRVALQERRRVRGPGGPGQDRRRVHRPHHGRPALVRGPAPGGRGEGGRADRGRERHGRDHHDPELLPPVREARRHDRHGLHRGQRVPRDLQARRHPDPDEPPDGPQGRERLHLQDQGREVPGGHRRHQAALRGRASPSWSAPSRSRSPSSWRGS